MKAANIEEFFGTLQESSVQTWREHLATSKYSSHIALDDFYNDIVEKVDALIEAYISINGKPKKYTNGLEDAESIDAIEYLDELREMVKDGRKFMNGETELESMLDDILGLIDSTIYKLRELHESLTDFIKRKLLNS